MRMPDDRALGDRLVAAGRMSGDALERCVAEKAARGVPLIDVLKKRGFLREDEVSRAQEFLETARAPSAQVAPAQSASGSPDVVGKRIGRYVVEGELGRGGMGVVYRALDSELRRLVALKVILDPSRAGAEEIARFRREAAACAQLRHPGIVSVFDVGEHEDHPFLAMELVEGESFEALLAKGSVAPRQVAEIVRGVALALEHAHSHGVIHRDVKPQNVIIDRAGEPHLMDFGLARTEAASSSLTATGEVLGTPAYMAPEQADGDPKEQGPWTDVYALGALLYRALAGKPPFEADSPQALLWKVISKDPVPPRKLDPRVPRDLETIALRCLAKEKERRIESARAVADELGRFVDGFPILSRPIGPLERASIYARRNPGRVAAIVLFVLLGGSVVVGIPLLRENATLRTSSEANEHKVRADRLMEKRDWNGAIAELSRTIELDPRRAQAWSLRGQARERKGDKAGAIADYTRGLELGDGSYAVFHNRGLLRAETGDLDGALRDATKAIELAPQVATCWRTRAKVRYERCDWAGVIADASRAIELDARDLESWTLRGKSRSETRDEAGAAADLGRALELEPNNEDVLYARATVLARRGDDSLAKADLLRAIELDPKDARAPTVLSSVLGRLGDLDGAIEQSTRAIALDPGFASAWEFRGLARQMKRDHAGAIADLTRALELPRRGREPWPRANAETWVCRAQARMETGDSKGALEDCSQAIAIDSGDANAWNSRAAIHLLGSDFERAISDLSRAVELAPRNALYVYNRGNARRRRGDLEGCRADCSRAIELDPRCKEAWSSRAEARLEAGDIDGAVADAARCLELDDRNLMALTCRAVAREKKGDTAGAMSDYERVIELAPDRSEAANVRARLEWLRRAK